VSPIEERVPNLDVQLTQAANSLVLANPAFAELYNTLSNNNFFRGAPLMLLLGLVWFGKDSKGQLRIIWELAAVCFATALSVRLQGLHLFHMRPMLDPSLGLRLPAGLTQADWVDSPPSWPSDTATLYTGLAAIVALEWRAIILPIAVWTFFVILLPRVAFGYHYTSDVLSGVFLGGGAVLLANLSCRWLDRTPGLRLRHALEKRPALANTLFMIGIWQMADLMFDPRAVIHSVASYLHG
jgi:undecaprenyl-diphosphatase